MDPLTVLALAIGLAMDSFAVSIAGGVTLKQIRLSNVLLISFIFGFFQGFMPVIGWLLGSNVRIWIQAYDHWVAFGLLAIIGGKMIYESIWIREVEKKVSLESLRFIIILAIATSIDALAVGLGFSLIASNIFTPALVIGLVTILMTSIGLYIGEYFGSVFENRVELFGGVILISIGLKILYEHIILGA